MEGKEKYDNQIKTILSIIQQSDSTQLQKIALETLYNKFYENRQILFLIFGNLINVSEEGNFRVIEEVKTYIESILEEFDSNTISKLLNYPYIKKQLEKELSENDIEPFYFTINRNNDIEIINCIEYIDFAEIINTNEIINLEFLYSEKSDKEVIIENESKSIEEEFNKSNLQILFPENDQFKKEIENCMDKKILSKNKKNEDVNKRFKLIDYYHLKRRKLELIKDESSKKTKKKKTNNNSSSNVNHLEIRFIPFYSLIRNLIQLNSDYSWKRRKCANILISIMNNFLDKIYFSIYTINCQVNSIETNGLYKVEIENMIITSNECRKDIKSLLVENLFSQLFLNSLQDKVVDFNCELSVCLLKEMNIKLGIDLLRYEDIVLNRKVMKVLIGKLNEIKFIKENDWQGIFTVLLFIKHFQNSEREENYSVFLENRTNLLSSISQFLEYDSEEIINLTIQILEKVLLDNHNFIYEKKIFEDFLDLIKRYDDIDKGVIHYFKCLVKFVNFFVFSTNQNDNTAKNYDKNTLNLNRLNKIVEENLIFFAFNKMIDVRICYYDVMCKLLFCFEINPRTIEENFLIAIQGLCLEDNKELLKIQQKFLFNLINIQSGQESFLQIINNNLKRIFKLMLTENINNTKFLFLPKTDDFELESLYKSFFISDLEKPQIKINYERKINYILPVLSLIMSKNINFTDYYLGYFSVSLNELSVSKNSIFMLKIYLNYLELIESIPTKILIFSDDQLINLSDQKLIDSNLPLSYIDNNSDFNYVFKQIMSILSNEILKVIDANQRNEVQTHYAKLQEYHNLFLSKKLIYINKIEDCLKLIVEHLNKKFSQDPSLIVFVQRLKFIENLPDTVNCKNLLRSLASCCFIVHNYFNNTKIEKISNIANSLINSLKHNTKDAKIFTKYLLILIKSSSLEVTNKILKIFFDNSINCFFEEMQNKLKEADSTNASKDSANNTKSVSNISISENIRDIKFLPLKYFFKFNFIYKDLDLNKFFENFFEFSTTNKEYFNENLKKYFIFIYILSKMKSQVFKFFLFKDFFVYLKDFLPYHSSFFSTEIFIEMVGAVLNNFEKCFVDLTGEGNITMILQHVFSEINSDQVFFIKLIDNLFSYERFQIESVQFTSSILSKISNKNKDIRDIAIVLFSKMMRIISFLKLDRKYEEIVSSDHSNGNSNHTNTNKSFDFLKNLFSQQVGSDIELKFKLKHNLRSYQMTGVKWLSFLGSNSLGAALCDDMGLGKTIQTLVCVINESINYFNTNKKYPMNIIICPNTLVLNWLNESKKFIEEKTAKIVELSVINFDSVYKKHINKKYTAKEKLKLDIFITSYDQIRDFNFAPFEFFYTVLDEAHIIKNMKSKIYQTIHKIVSERKIILTGTPIQNNIMELWTLFDFLMPGFLGNENDFEINYQKKIQTNIKKLNLEEKLQENIFQVSLSEIRKRIRPFILRRLKQDVLKELPEKIINDYICELTETQRKIYDYYEKIFNQEKKKESKKKTTIIKDENNMQSLKLINRLRKICNYPGFILSHPEDIAKMKLTMNEILHIQEFESSAKLNSLEDIFLTLGFEQNNFNQENRLLIFSQGNKSINLIEDFLKKKYNFLRISKLSSDLSSEKRMELVNEFNDKFNIDVLLLTTSIGGLGLSLTAANIVIMFDHDWNPMKDLQAMDRAHRLGQTKTVQVFR